jgi:hypothetical protein
MHLHLARYDRVEKPSERTKKEETKKHTHACADHTRSTYTDRMHLAARSRQVDARLDRRFLSHHRAGRCPRVRRLFSFFAQCGQMFLSRRREQQQLGLNDERTSERTQRKISLVKLIPSPRDCSPTSRRKKTHTHRHRPFICLVQRCFLSLSLPSKFRRTSINPSVVFSLSRRS